MSDSLIIKKKEYIESDDLKILAEEIMEKEQLNISPPAKLKFLKVYPDITKTKVGVCIRASNELRLFSGAHYVIEMSGVLWDSLDDNTKYVLMYHELLHPMPVMNEQSDEWDFKIRKHDVQDFHHIISKYGVEWFTNLKTLASSVYNLTPEQESSITL